MGRASRKRRRPIAIWLWLSIAAMLGITGFVLWQLTVDSLTQIEVEVASDRPECGAWAERMRAAGFRVRVERVSPEHVMEATKGLALPFVADTCHHAHTRGGQPYILLGDIDPGIVRQLLDERPQIVGLAARLHGPTDRDGPKTWAFGGLKSFPQPWPRPLPKPNR